VESSEGLKYDKHGIKFKTKFTAADVKALNELVKSPTFEIRRFSVEEVLKMQKEVKNQ